jgi:hypothetical protein
MELQGKKLATRQDMRDIPVGAAVDDVLARGAHEQVDLRIEAETTVLVE